MALSGHYTVSDDLVLKHSVIHFAGVTAWQGSNRLEPTFKLLLSVHFSDPKELIAHFFLQTIFVKNPNITLIIKCDKIIKKNKYKDRYTL